MQKRLLIKGRKISLLVIIVKETFSLAQSAVGAQCRMQERRSQGIITLTLTLTLLMIIMYGWFPETYVLTSCVVPLPQSLNFGKPDIDVFSDSNLTCSLLMLLWNLTDVPPKLYEIHRRYVWESIKSKITFSSPFIIQYFCFMCTGCVFYTPCITNQSAWLLFGIRMDHSSYLVSQELDWPYLL